jgi:hypothetical protein
MEKFDALQDIWNQQKVQNTPVLSEEIIAKATAQTKKMATIHLSTILILSVTLLCLTGFFLWLKLRNSSLPYVGILMMILSLFSRIILEFISSKKFKKVNILSDFDSYTKEITRFYTFRKSIQFIVTPLSIGCYLIGFLLLLPFFKQGVSNSFFLYILISGSLFFVFITWIIIRQVKQELSILDFLKNTRAVMMNDEL